MLIFAAIAYCLLRLRGIGISIVGRKAPNRVADQETFEPFANEWRVQMKKFLAAIAAMIAVTFAIPNPVNAGASASAPSKYAQANRSSVKQAAHQTYSISEYSSSARRNKH